MLTIIIPTKQSLIKPDCTARLWSNLYRLTRHPAYGKGFCVWVADSSRYLGGIGVGLACLFWSAHYFKVAEKHRYYSPAQIKNYALKAVFDQGCSSHVLFLDVDVLLTDEFIDHVLGQVAKQVAFDWYPVDFLIKELDGRQMQIYIDNKYLNQIPASKVLQTGYSTGLQLLSQTFFEQTGGYDERFVGYGCEDIELIHRATAILGLRDSMQADSAYYQDDRGYDPSLLQGFRNYFYRLKQQNPLPCRNPCHFWHVRKNDSDYLKNRKANDDKLLEIMREFDGKNL